MKFLFRTVFLFIGFCHLPYALWSQDSPKYEFRGAWIATLLNIDWPSKAGLTVAEQKAEFITLLDSLQGDGINAVIVQIRPAADAFFPSPYEPWSEYLNGVQGLAPAPYYDPLKFMIAATHSRGMEFHAWINPYRAVFNIHTSSVAPDHITRTQPDWFVTYGDKKYFNPGIPAVMKYVTAIIKDIVTRYDVDAIHLDDYFYPYRITGKIFPDQATFVKYGRGLSLDDWRRSNCDSIIKMIHDTILSVKPLIKFGISPFGVWRNADRDPEGSNTKASQTDYDDLYADVLLWLKKGWIDYVAPQLYWEIGHSLCDYTTLLQWWGDHSFGKQVYIGHGIYHTTENVTPAWLNPNELPRQLTLLRENKNIQGSIFFSAGNLLGNPNGWEDSLRNNYYHEPALIPPMSWIDTVAPKKPALTLQRVDPTKFSLAISRVVAGETETVRNYVIYYSDNPAELGQHPVQIIPAGSLPDISFDILTSQLPKNWHNCYIAVSCVDRENNESALSNVIRLINSSSGWFVLKR